MIGCRALRSLRFFNRKVQLASQLRFVSSVDSFESCPMSVLLSAAFLAVCDLLIQFTTGKMLTDYAADLHNRSCGSASRRHPFPSIHR